MAIQSDPDGPFDFSALLAHLPPPAAMCAVSDVFRYGMVLPSPSAAPPPNGTGRASDCRRRVPHEARGDSSFDDPPRRSRGGGSGKKAEYQRLRSAPECSDAKAPPKLRPRRHLRVLGPLGAPPATMDLNDIRSRQRRRNHPAAAESGARGGEVSPRTWKLLSSLSCKGVESAAVVPAWASSRTCE